MKCNDDEKEERLKAQKEAQAKMEEKREEEKQKRIKELEAGKQADLLKAASRKR